MRHAVFSVGHNQSRVKSNFVSDSFDSNDLSYLQKNTVISRNRNMITSSILIAGRILKMSYDRDSPIPHLKMHVSHKFIGNHSRLLPQHNISMQH